MLIVNDVKYNQNQFKSTVITIGNFDGVHIGHQTLLSKTVKKAKEIDGTSLAITFKPHPTQIINQHNPIKLITSYKQKIELIAKLDIDVLLCIPFTNEFASISAKKFMQKLLINALGMRIIVIGKDYIFGKNREGNVELLKQYAIKLNFQVIVEELVYFSKITKNHRISSTLIRNMITEGDVENANKLLGRNYCMQGIIVRGKGRGRKILGFPTINVKPDNNLYPKTGVYAVTIKYNNEIMNGVANIGYSPTFQNEEITLEVHVISLNSNIYGKKVKVNFIKRLRPEIKFSNIQELIAQIYKDIKEASKILPLEKNQHD